MQQRNGLSIIHQSGNHLLTLINDILDLSKIEARKLELYPVATNLSSFLSGVVGLMRMRAQEKQLNFNFETVGALPEGIEADDKRLRQILLNLIGNAIKFTPQGEVTLRVEALGEVVDSQQQLRFEVIDTGVGLRPEDTQTIFQPFEQVGEVSQRTEGTGLGLTITRQLVRLMGGELQVESELGQGSTFVFEARFPALNVVPMVEDGASAGQQLIGYKGRPRTILVVDDKEVNRRVLQEFLEPLGFTVITAENGQEEIDQAKALGPDLILSDLVMPVKTGFEAIAEIRQVPELEAVPVIAISASMLEIHQDRGKLSEFDGFLPKPVDEQHLLKIIEQLLELEWVYQYAHEEEVEENEGVMRVPSSELLESLYEMIMVGDIWGLQEKVQKLKEIDRRYSQFAQQVEVMVQNIDEQGLINLFEQYLEIAEV